MTKQRKNIPTETGDSRKMRGVDISDLQKIAEKQAENFAQIQLSLNSIMAFLQLLLNIQTQALAEKFEVPFETIQSELNQTLASLKQQANKATLENARLFAEFQKQKKRR